MEVKRLQSEIVKSMEKWDKLKGKKYSKNAAFAHLVEEVGELAQEFVHKERSQSKYNEEKLIDAIGDIFIYVVLLASLFKVDIEQLIVDILKQDKIRRSREGL
ncbi:hypothetical protein JW698_00225 [Candidatus Wolfebacteria bacterium]|nr:hypothetical protein [Candidatus Wolfebacteria bacterium]